MNICNVRDVAPYLLGTVKLGTTLPSNRAQEPDNYPDSNSTTASNNNESPLDININEFLSGGLTSIPDAPSPLPTMGPGEVVELALNSLRNKSPPETGSVTFLKCCAPLQRSEKWGVGNTEIWKEIMRGAITPSMFRRRLLSSPFSILFDWKSLSVTESYSYSSFGRQVNMASTAFVNVALFFEEGVEPILIVFTLKKSGGVWLIENVVFNKPGLFRQE